MADKDLYDDDYQFSDLDAIAPDAEQAAASETAATPSVFQNPMSAAMKKKAVLVVIGLIAIVVLFEFVGSFFSSKKTTLQPSAPVVAPLVKSAPLQAAVIAAPAVDPQVMQQLSTLESADQTLRTDLSTVKDEVNGLSKNMADLMQKMTELSGVVTNLSAKLDEQARAAEQATIRREAALRVHRVVHKAIHYPTYHLQAVIPGRAWLIATNGATLTVREGTLIAGYGIVTLIDPKQGRVTTNSGQVIRFAESDS